MANTNPDVTKARGHLGGLLNGGHRDDNHPEVVAARAALEAAKARYFVSTALDDLVAHWSVLSDEQRSRIASLLAKEKCELK